MLKFILFLSLLSSSLAVANPHIPLDLTLEESQRWYKEIAQNKSLIESQDAFITASIRAGERMSAWLKMINEARSEDDQIRLTNSSDRGNGIPIEAASKYGPSTIKSYYENLQTQMPSELQEIMLKDGEITASFPGTTEDLVLWARKVSYNYQTAVRWTGMQQWLGWYARARARDVRGFYFLGKVEDLDSKLGSFDTLDEEIKADLKKNLITICYNSTTNEAKCEKLFESSLSKNDLVKFKDTYFSVSQKVWDSFFKIPNPRKDVEWSRDNRLVMRVPFKTPTDSHIASWLQSNVEDEFKRDSIGWGMELDFVNGNPSTAYLEFKPNVTPHVSGGNVVVMDQNTPLEEFDTRWTIRHEFGHILRLPDCYHEFYVESENVMVNYQLDVTDLMCSRSGDMNDRIYEELKRAYLK